MIKNADAGKQRHHVRAGRVWQIVSIGAVRVLVLVVVCVSAFLYMTPSPDDVVFSDNHIDVEPPEILYWAAAGDDNALTVVASDRYNTTTDYKKKFNEKTKTITIKDTANLMTVRLISSEPDLCNFREIFEITNFKSFTPTIDKDFKARTVKHRGNNTVAAVERFIEQNVSYTVNITDYKAIQVEKEIYNNKAGKNETILVNDTVISGYHDETRYKNVWNDYKPYAKETAKDAVQKIKVVYHTPPEIEDVRIQTIPTFRGVEFSELTWWNTSWTKRKEITLTGGASGARTDYQLNLSVMYDTDMQADFADLRFTNDTYQIDAWLESKTDSTSAAVWVEFPTIPASGVNQTYYV